MAAGSDEQRIEFVLQFPGLPQLALRVGVIRFEPERFLKLADGLVGPALRQGVARL